MFIMAILQNVLMAKAGARLSQCIRLLAFKSMLRQECGWFDRKENAVGFLSANLSGDAANIQNVCILDVDFHFAIRLL